MDYPKTLHRKNEHAPCGFESISVASEAEHEDMTALGFGESLLAMGIETHPSQETLKLRRLQSEAPKKAKK